MKKGMIYYSVIPHKKNPQKTGLDKYTPPTDKRRPKRDLLPDLLRPRLRPRYFHVCAARCRDRVNTP